MSVQHWRWEQLGSEFREGGAWRPPLGGQGGETANSLAWQGKCGQVLRSIPGTLWLLERVESWGREGWQQCLGWAAGEGRGLRRLSDLPSLPRAGLQHRWGYWKPAHPRRQQHLHHQDH